MAKILTIPEAWSHRRDFSQKLKNLYAYATAVMEAWDGPAAICGAHGDWAIAGMDRNGLRPARYIVTDDNLIIMASEVGVLPEIPEEKIICNYLKWEMKKEQTILKKILIDIQKKHIKFPKKN